MMLFVMVVVVMVVFMVIPPYHSEFPSIFQYD